MEGMLSMYATGELQERHQALFAMMQGAVQKHKKDAKGVLSMRGVRIGEGTVNFFLTLGSMAGAFAVKFVSKNLLGWELKLDNLRRKIPRILNLPANTSVELIDPSPEQMDVMSAMLLKGFRRRQPVICVHMDPTKLNGTL
eukprot:3295185-Prymnesium_polylepis.1